MVDAFAKDSPFSASDVEVLSRQPGYQGFFRVDKVQLRHKLFAGGWSQPITREVFMRGQAVAAVIYDPNADQVGLVEQFRIGALDQANGPWLYEIVAGMTEAGEMPEAVITRELAEEAGVTASKLIPICDYFTSPGGTDESLTLFCALADLSEAGGLHGLAEEGEDIRVVVAPATEVFAQLYSGCFNNAATLIALQWLAMNRNQLRKQEYHDPD